MACAAVPRDLDFGLSWGPLFHVRDQPTVVEPEELPLTSATIDALLRLLEVFEEIRIWGPLREYQRGIDRDRDLDDDWPRFEHEAVRLWQVIREELGPSYQVSFCSDRFRTSFETPEEYVREVASPRPRDGSWPPSSWTP